VAKIGGDGAVNQLRLKSTKDATISVLPVAVVSIAIGLKPDTGYLQGVVSLDKKGYIITNEVMETRISRIFVAGDEAAAVSAEGFLSLP